MTLFYNKQEEENKRILAAAREVLFQNKYKFFQLPKGTQPEVAERARRTAGARAPEPDFLHFRRGWTPERVLSFAGGRAARLDRYLKLIQTPAALISTREREARRARAQERAEAHASLEGARARAGAFGSTLPDFHARRLAKLLSREEDIERINTIIDSLENASNGLLGLALNCDYSDIQDHAQRLADEYVKAYGTAHCDDDVRAVVKSAEKRLPGWKPGPKWSIASTSARLVDPHFWARRLKRQLSMSSIQCARILQIVGSNLWQQKYLPLDVTRRIRQQDKALEEWMSVTVLTNGKVSRTLQDITSNSLKNQLSELKVKELARDKMNRDAGMNVYFVTCTTPSRFHSTARPRNARHSIPNPKFNPRLTPQDGVEWYDSRWNRFKGWCAKHGLTFGVGCDIDYFTVLEGHKDCTPHFHSLLYVRPGLENRVFAKLKRLFIDSDNERGADRHRLKIEKPRSAHATQAYIQKALDYLLKTKLSEEKADREDLDQFAEANFTRAIGRRRIRSGSMRVSEWRECRNRGAKLLGLTEPQQRKMSSEDEELSNMLDEMFPSQPPEYESSPLLPPPQEIIDGFAATRGDPGTGKTTPDHYVTFYRSGIGGRGWLKVYTLDQLYDIEPKTIHDFIVQCEGDVEAAYEEYESAQAAYCEDPESIRARAGVFKSIKRKTNRAGDPLTPGRPASLIYLLPFGGHLEIQLSDEKWELDVEASRLLEEALKAKKALVRAVKRTEAPEAAEAANVEPDNTRAGVSAEAEPTPWLDIFNCIPPLGSDVGLDWFLGQRGQARHPVVPVLDPAPA